MAISKLILNGETQMDVTSNTNTSNNMLSGVVGTKNDGTSVTGNIASKSSTDLTASGATVTAPAGYYANAASKAVSTTTHPNPTASIASSTGVVTASHTQTTGYVTSGTTTGTLNLTTQAATTYNTSTADQTIASNRWLTGTQTIKSVVTSNLTAANIAEGVTVKVGDVNNASRITQVTGTHSGATSYTATITGTGGNGPSLCYVQHNNETTKYYTNGDTIIFKEGDTFTFTVDKYPTSGGSIYLNNELIATKTGNTVTYTWTAPVGNINIILSASGGSIQINTLVMPAGVITLSSAGTHNVYSYAQATIAEGSAFPPATTITQAPTITINTSGVVTATYNSSSSITPTVTSGYISQGTAGTISITGTSTYQLYSQAATTYYPSTTDQTIYSLRWLVGNQTIKSVTTSNLTASNIAEGVVVQVGDSANASRITQITGTHVDSNKYTITITSTASYYRCIIYKGVHYYTAGQSFQISAGETIELYNSSSTRFLYINGENVLMPENSYIYTPSGDINVDLSKGSTISIYESIIPTGSMPITSNASYNVYGYSAVNVDVNFDIDVEAPYYNAYKTIALKSGISSSNTDIVSYFNTISSIKAYQFEDIYMSGSFTFPVCTIIGNGGFQHTDYNHCYFCTFDFPEVESIGLFAFKLQSRLTSINAPKATVIKTQAFMSCTSLQTVNFPKVTSIGSSAFYACQALTTVSFPEALYIYTSAFCSCNNLSSISFPKVSQIGSYAFARCYALTTISFPSATSIGISAFYACRNLSSISFPNTTDIDVDAFHSCSNLTTADFPSATIINDSAFYNCTSLTTINAPAVTSIGGYVFTNCSSLLSIDFPQVSIVGTQAFHSCINLSIARFSKLTSISAYAFRYCYNLLSLYLLGSSVVSLGTTALAYTPISNYTTSTGGVYGSIFVPSSLYSSYLTATNWSVYSARIVSV